MYRLARIIPFMAACLVVGFAHHAQAQCSVGVPQANSVLLYADPNWRGACLEFWPSTIFAMPAGWDNKVSSIKVGSTVRAILFEHPNCTGKQATYESSSNWAKMANVDDRTSSLVVESTNGARLAYEYRNNFPNNLRADWTNGGQGFAHDASHWFYTRNIRHLDTFGLPDLMGELMKIPLTASLNDSSPPRQSVMMPRWMRDEGYNHYGDPEQHRGYIFIPLEAPTDLHLTPRLLVYRASNLEFVNWDYLPTSDWKCAWTAINPANETLYTSAGNLHPTSGLLGFTIDWNLIEDPQAWFLARAPEILLSDRDGGPLDVHVIQGGAFSNEEPIFYLGNSEDKGQGKGLRAFDLRTNRLIARSGNTYGPFNLQIETGRQEVEGLDFLNIDTLPLVVPGMQGQLHLLLLANELPINDQIYFKHYRK